MSVEISLQDEVALVTGGGSGIGRETALHLARAGADVIVVDLDEAGARETSALVGETGRIGHPLVADVTDAAAVEAGLAASPLRSVSICVNNAFWARPGPFLSASAADDAKTLQVIAMGTLTVTRAVLPAMIERGGGAVVNVMSEAGRVGEAGMVAYSMAKAAVGGFTRALAKEIGRKGVRVNAVSPGATRTPATLAQLDDDTMARLAKSYPLGRLGEAEDIAGAILWLASPLASWVTGQVLSVSGGFTMA